mmetsp:Transcript_15060/g.36765  ORF Transcript_15060/g.36765 Transcript_15060/m.36765 type:complete len:224 (+) Transcript_15060:2002-2673(+)
MSWRRLGPLNTESLNDSLDQTSLSQSDLTSLLIPFDVNTKESSNGVFLLKLHAFAAKCSNCLVNVLLLRRKEQSIIDIDQTNAVLRDEQARINVGLRHESNFLQIGLQELEEIAWRLFQSVETTLQFQYLPRFRETSRHGNIHLFFDGCMQESSRVVDLLRGEFEHLRENQHQSHSVPVDNWCPSLMEVDILDLSITSDTKSCLEFSDTSVWIALALECPSRR